MRNGTAIFLLGLILLVAVYGWTAIGWLAVILLGIFVLVWLLIVVAVWSLRRRLRRDLQQVMANQAAQARQPPKPAEGVTIIDVEGKDPRDEGR